MENRKFTTGLVRSFDRKTAEETREIEFVISDETRDRHGTVIPLDSWNIDRFNANGIVGYQHEVHGSFLGDSNPDRILGPGEAFFEDGKLIGRVKFETEDINPLAEKLFRKVLNGTLKATSVGFIEKERGKWGEGEEARDGSNPTYYFKSVELLEFSIVNIPSNPNALRRSLDDENELEVLRKRKQQLEEENEALVNRNADLSNRIKSLEIDKQVLTKMNGLRG